MKKKILLIFSLLLSIVFINTVNAKEPYYSGWKIEGKEVKDINAEDHFFYNIEYNNGYLILEKYANGYSYDYTFKQYSESGELIKTKEIDNIEIFNYLVDGENIYFYILEEDIFYIRKYDKNLSQVAEYETVSGPFAYMDMRNELAGLRIKNGYLYALESVCFYSCTLTVEQIELDLSDGKILEDEADVIELSPVFAEDNVLDTIENYGEINVQDLLPDYYVYWWANPQYKDGKFLFGAALTKDEDICIDLIYKECYTNNIILQENGKELFNIELEESAYYIDSVRFIGDNILVLAKDQEERKHTIYIYNPQGELLQKIEYETNYLRISETSKGFAVASRKTDIDTSSLKVDYEVYYRYFETNTNAVGKGDVVLAKDYKAGEEVTLNITPKEGYVLGEIKVTDSKGNKIEVTNNTFIMPADDINVEVVFNEIKENPNTADIITTIAIIAVIASGLLIYSNKITKEMK